MLNDILILFFPIRFIIITMAKIYIFLMALIISVDSRRVTNKPQPSQQAKETITFQQSHPIQFEELQPILKQFFANESDLPKISEYSQVEAIYPHAKVLAEQSQIVEKRANSANTSKRLVEKQSVKQQTQTRRVERKIQQKAVNPNEKNDTVTALSRKSPKQLKQAEKVYQSGPSSLGLRKQTQKKTEDEQSNYLFDFTQLLFSQSLLIALLALCLFGLFLLSKCCKDRSNYQGLSPNDQQSSFTN